MKNLINFNKENKDYEETEEDKKNKRMVIGFFCFLAFIIIYFFINDIPLFDKNNNINNIESEQKESEEENESLIEKLEAYKNYYKKTRITSDKGIIEVEVETDGTKLVGTKKTYKENINFAYNNNFYVLNKKTFVKNENFAMFDDFDTTFNDVNNIVKLIESQDYTTDINNNFYINEYEISLSEAIRIYNLINNTTYFVKDSGKVIVKIYYNENIEKIFMDLTDMYSLIDGVTYILFEYDIEFDRIDEVNLDNLDELINSN